MYVMNSVKKDITLNYTNFKYLTTTIDWYYAADAEVVLLDVSKRISVLGSFRELPTSL